LKFVSPREIAGGFQKYRLNKSRKRPKIPENPSSVLVRVQK
jgi:hypothetical protein